MTPKVDFVTSCTDFNTFKDLFVLPIECEFSKKMCNPYYVHYSQMCVDSSLRSSIFRNNIVYFRLEARKLPAMILAVLEK